MLRAVLFISDSTLNEQHIEQEQINDIKESSINVNNQRDITGVLAHYKKKFLHILEGESSNIEQLLKNIKNDLRNENFAILLDSEHEQRIYNNWDLVESPCPKQIASLGLFLQRNIDHLPNLEEKQHDTLEEFVTNIFS